jgi:hypothetical protein
VKLFERPRPSCWFPDIRSGCLCLDLRDADRDAKRASPAAPGASPEAQARGGRLALGDLASRGVEEKDKCARGGERFRRPRHAGRVALRGATSRPGSARELAQGPHGPDAHARLRERTSMSFLQSEETLSSGAAGVAVARFRKRRGAQAPRVAPRSGAEESESALCGRPSAQTCYADDLATKPWAPSTAAQRSRAKAAADRARMSETATPAAPRRAISERLLPPRSATRRSAQRRRHIRPNAMGCCQKC